MRVMRREGVTECVIMGITGANIAGVYIMLMLRVSVTVAVTVTVTVTATAMRRSIVYATAVTLLYPLQLPFASFLKLHACPRRAPVMAVGRRRCILLLFLALILFYLIVVVRGNPAFGEDVRQQIAKRASLCPRAGLIRQRRLLQSRRCPRRWIEWVVEDGGDGVSEVVGGGVARWTRWSRRCLFRGERQ